MENKIINGVEIAAKIDLQTAEEIKAANLSPELHIIVQGNNSSCEFYIKNIEKKCGKVKINTTIHRINESVSEIEFAEIIKSLNNDKNVNAIMIQMPLSEHINVKNIQQMLSPKKDVDGCHKENLGLLITGSCPLPPCTPYGVIELLKQSNIEIKGKNICIIGRSLTVGKPMALMLLNENATVTVCHSQTQNLKEVTKQADILICAIGKAEFVNADFVKKDAVVIDVGTNLKNGKLTGDVDFEDVLPIVSKITPVPGGVGQMTVSMLMKNVLTACKIR